MATYERHLTSRRLRNVCYTSSSETKDALSSKADTTRRASSRNARRTKSLRAHHHPATPGSSASAARPGNKMDRIDRSLKELAQLLGLQTVGVDEASLLETTVSFFRAFPDSANTLDTNRRGGGNSDFNQAVDSSVQSEQSSDASPTDAILAGFQDCMEETIRYLVDIEGFSPDDEVVVGLTAHLLQVRSKLDINNDSTAATPWSHGNMGSGEGPTECEATTSTQTSPQETNTLSMALTTDSRHPPALPNSDSAKTLPGRTLPRGMTPAHLMTPLTVDTNQYYALPSPLNRTAMACAMKPSEPLLTVAPTRPTHAPTYTSAVAASSITGHPLTSSAQAFQRLSAVPTAAVQQPYQSVLSANGCLIPCVPATASGQRPYGLDLNYVAPYVVAWVRPVQE